MALISKKTLVEVTAGDIAVGVPRSSCDCPIARAIKRTAGTIAVVADVIGFWVNGQQASVLGGSAVQFMEKFDDDETRHLCRPFAFNLTYWDPTP